MVLSEIMKQIWEGCYGAFGNNEANLGGILCGRWNLRWNVRGC